MPKSLDLRGRRLDEALRRAEGAFGLRTGLGGAGRRTRRARASEPACNASSSTPSRPSARTGGVTDGLVLRWINAETMTLFLAIVTEQHADEFIVMDLLLYH